MTDQERKELVELQALGSKATKPQQARIIELMSLQLATQPQEVDDLADLAVSTRVTTALADATDRQRQLVQMQFTEGCPIASPHKAKEAMTEVENPEYVQGRKRTATQTAVSTSITKIGNLNRDDTPEESHAKAQEVVDHIATELPQFFFAGARFTGKTGEGGVQLNYKSRLSARANSESRSQFMQEDNYASWAKKELERQGHPVTKEAIDAVLLLREEIKKNLAIK